MSEQMDRGSGAEETKAFPVTVDVGEPVPEDPGGEADLTLVAMLQALLFISDEGLSDERLAAAVDRPLDSTRAAIAALRARLEQPGSGIVLREHASGWRLTTAQETAEVLERFVIDGHTSRLSPAALETLAVVAYQQPVSRGRIAAIRGVAVDGVMRTLVARGLVEEAGAETSGAILYATTGLFMDKLGVKSLTELPDLAPLLPDIETLDGFDDRPVSAPQPTEELPAVDSESAQGPADPGEHASVTDRADLVDVGDGAISSPLGSGALSGLSDVFAQPNYLAETSQRGVQPDPNGDADGDN